MAVNVEAEFARLDGRVDNVEALLARHDKEDEGKWGRNQTEHDEINKKVDRPPWLFVWVMGVMGTALGALAMYAIKG